MILCYTIMYSTVVIFIIVAITLLVTTPNTKNHELYTSLYLKILTLKIIIVLAYKLQWNKDKIHYMQLLMQIMY